MTSGGRSHVPAAATSGTPEGGCTQRGHSPATADGGRAALVCLRDGLAEITFWRDRAEAEEADCELSPCGERCQLAHEIVQSLGAECFRVSHPILKSTGGQQQ